MGMPILILGESGTGKTTSLRNFENVALVNVTGKPLPFKAKFETLKGTTNADEIIRFMKNTKAKVIIIDDCQYIMSFQYMRRIKENGWDKFNEIQSDFFNIIDAVNTLPDDVIVYFLSHIENVDGRQKIKTIGKMLDEKITIEGMFTTVLKTHVSDGKYYFLTQNSGSDTVKSPLGMFADFAIDNDLKYVDDKIRNYYQIGDYKSDEEMSKADEEVSRPELEKTANGRVKRTTQTTERKPRVAKAEPEAIPTVDELTEKLKEVVEKAETPTRRTRKVRETPALGGVSAPKFEEIGDDDLPF